MPIEKKNKKQKPSSAAPRSILLISATGKIQNHRLKESLRRARNRRALSHLVDAAIPSHLRLEGIANANEQSVQTRIEIGSPTLSPFVLHLANNVLPTPEELLHEEDLTSVRLNFLLPSSSSSHRPTTTNTLNDLLLERSEIQSQLEEDLTKTPPVMLPAMEHHPRSFDVLLPYSRGIKLPHHMTLSIRESFEPTRVPEDILSYFDLPEEDEPLTMQQEEQEEPDDVLDLDLLTAQLEDQPSYESVEEEQQPSWMPYGWKRAIAGFVAISFVFVLPIHAMNLVQQLRDAKSNIEASSFGAVDLLKDGAGAAMGRDVAQAHNAFSDASIGFTQAQKTLDDLGTGTQLLLSVLPATHQSFTSGEALLHAGRSLSIAATRLTEGFNEMQEDVNPTPVTRSKLLRTYLKATLPHVQDAAMALDDVNINDIPADYREQFSTLQSTLPFLVTSLQDLDHVASFAEAILGANGSKRYLLVFQNNTELRPTGGFMGSFAEIKVRDGLIETMEVPGGGTYDLQGSLKTNLVAPKPLQLLKARWEFQDANWFPDFPTSARQIIQFYTDSGGPSVDGVIAVNATYVADLLELLGPVEMPDYGRTIDRENFLFEAQKIVELEYDKEENKPKQFIGDLAPILIDRAIKQSSEKFMDFVDVLGKGLQTRDIQLYVTNDDLEQIVQEQGWGGTIIQTPGDYLMLIDTNLGGGKTDSVIEQQATLDVQISEDGTIVNTLTVTRTHHGMKQELFTGLNNVDYLRVYVPKGATLLKASGFTIPDEGLFKTPDEDWVIDDDVYYSTLAQQTDLGSKTLISEESGKTVFGNWIQTAPGTTSTATFVYKLPFTLSGDQAPSWFDHVKTLIGLPTTSTYTLVLQKQSGVIDRTTDVHVSTPAQLTTLWSSLLEPSSFSNDTDAFVGLLFETSSL